MSTTKINISNRKIIEEMILAIYHRVIKGTGDLKIKLQKL